MVAKDACEEGSVSVVYCAQVGINGKTTRGEYQFGDLWSQNLHRAVGTMSVSGTLSACGGYIGV